MSTVSDQKKRTLEALQQQFSAAKAKKLQDEQLKCQKKNSANTPKLKFDATRKGKAPKSAPYKKSYQHTPHKGIATSSSGHQQKASAASCGESNPVYDELSFALHDNLFQNGISDLNGTEVVRNVVYDIIQKGGEAGRITKGSKKLKLEKGILLDNYVQRGPKLVDAQARSLLIHSKRSKRHMSLKQHKKYGSFDLDRKFHKFDLYKPMHEMWKDYIRELTKITPKKQLSENLLQADLHGALLIVAECKAATVLFLYGLVVSIVAECKAATYQGVSGIMIRDTAETFGIISEDNCYRGDLHWNLRLYRKLVWFSSYKRIGDKLSPKEKLKEDQRQQRAQSLIR